MTKKHRRSLVQFICYLPATIILKDPLFGVRGERWYLFLRSLFGFICFSLNYYSLAFVSLSDASSIAFSAPVFVSIFACLILREPCTLFQITTIIVTLIGVVMIARPAFMFPGDESDRHFHRDERVIGTILSFATSLSMAFTYVVMRRLQKTPITTVITYFSFFCLCSGGMTAVILNHVKGYQLYVPSGTRDLCLMLLNGLCGAVGQTFLVIALKIEQASLVSLARSFDIVMAFIYQIILLKQAVTIMSVSGALIVLSSCAACALKKFIDAKPDAFNRILARFR